MRKLRCAVVGVGHLGKEHARILAGLPDVELVAVADANPDQGQAIAQKLGTRYVADSRELIGLVEAASIVVPTSLHRAVAGEFLKAGVPLLIEKPLAASLAEAAEMVDLASKYGTLLQVGHIERFNPAYVELKQRPLRPQYLQAERLGLFSGRAMDVGVVLDLMIHDLDLVLDLVPQPIVRIEAQGIALFGGHEDLAQARLTFRDGTVADLKASRVNPQPVRRLACWGAEGFAELDFAQRTLRLMQPSPELRREGIDFRRLPLQQTLQVKEQLFTRHLPSVELQRKEGDQLTLELREFLDCVRHGRQPRVSGVEGLRAVEVAHLVLRAMAEHRWAGGLDEAGPRQLLQLSQGDLFEPYTPAAAKAA